MIWIVLWVLIALFTAGWMTRDWNNGRTVTIDVLTGLCWPLIVVMGCVWIFVAAVSETKRVTKEFFSKEKTK